MIEMTSSHMMDGVSFDVHMWHQVYLDFAHTSGLSFDDKGEEPLTSIMNMVNNIYYTSKP